MLFCCGGVLYIRRLKSLPVSWGYDACRIGLCAFFIMFSINIPYPVVGLPISTWVMAPTKRPSCTIGLPDRCVVNKGQQLFVKMEYVKVPIGYPWGLR